MRMDGCLRSALGAPLPQLAPVVPGVNGVNLSAAPRPRPGPPLLEPTVDEVAPASSLPGFVQPTAHQASFRPWSLMR